MRRKLRAGGLRVKLPSTGKSTRSLCTVKQIVDSDMICVNGFDDLIGARLLDFLSPAAVPWHRRLWTIGSILLVEELLEASEAVHNSVLTEGSFRNLRTAAQQQIGPDPGVGDAAFRSALRVLVNTELRHGGVDFRAVSNLLQQLKRIYLRNWHHALTKGDANPPIERTPRLIAAHFLDSGFSPKYLAEWWTQRLRTEPGGRSLSDILAEAETLLTKARTVFEILKGFRNAPGVRRGLMPAEWRDARQVAQWLRLQGHSPENTRIVGGLLLKIEAYDKFAAVQGAIDIVERISARVLIGTITYSDQVTASPWPNWA